MKKLIAIATILIGAHLFIGYYNTLWAEDNHRVFFIKHRPTWQTELINLYASDADDKPLDKLSALERNVVRDYCFYRLGIETWLEDQAQLDACKQR